MNQNSRRVFNKVVTHKINNEMKYDVKYHNLVLHGDPTRKPIEIILDNDSLLILFEGFDEVEEVKANHQQKRKRLI